MLDIVKLQKAIIRENLEGWLFFNFHHKDDFADRFLKVDPEAMNSRRWFYFVPAEGEPTAIVHAIETDPLNHLPGSKKIYSKAEELEVILKPLACRCGTAFSEKQTSLSYLDHGTAIFLTKMGYTLKSAEGLIQRTMSLLSENQMASHEKAAEALYTIVDEIWEEIKKAFQKGKKISERTIQESILYKIAERGMVTEHRPIVASGQNSGNPHYGPAEDSPDLEDNEIVQFDLWGKFPGEDGIYADISQVGYLGSTAPEYESALFQTILDARDTAVKFISDQMKAGEEVRGREVDEAARKVIISRGKEEWISHRTGHGIDAEIHGWGVNMDSIEFPDDRLLLDGSCFSIEPGIYSGEIGCRTEINVYIKNGTPVISGGPIQKKLRTLR
ncbi:MAG: aminopeptidase P family protein [Spirochaetales bacterium]|nr:aminopeptidase P family protein [Spirochaetales bacterium]